MYVVISGRSLGMHSIIHSLLGIRHWVEWIIGSWLALLVAIVSLQQVAVILASNVGLTERMLCHSRCFFLMVELLFFAQSVFVGRFLLLA